MSDAGAHPPVSPDELPFVAPCRRLRETAPLNWLRLGWRDFRRAPKQSLTLGLVAVAVSWLVAALGWYLGNVAGLAALLSGFLILGPALAIGFYSISQQLDQGRSPVLGYCLQQDRRHLGNILVFSLILLVVFLIWARAASMVHIFFPETVEYQWRELLPFLGIGSAVGAVFASVIFAASAFSLPMIMDRKTDVVTAVVTSVNAVLRNKPAMLVWATVIVLVVLVGFATAFLGFAVLIPVIGHATWHGYRETVDASAWPLEEIQDIH